MTPIADHPGVGELMRASFTLDSHGHTGTYTAHMAIDAGIDLRWSVHADMTPTHILFFQEGGKLKHKQSNELST